MLQGMTQGMATAIDEFDLIARHFAPLARDMPGALGLRDDAAVLRPDAGFELVISADAVVAGVHFPETAGPHEIARRALRVNLSDIAAKGAVPLGYTLTLQLPADVDDAWLSGFADGLEADQREYALGLLGGDTTKTPGPLTLSINIFGQSIENNVIIRSGARAGDDIYVTGTIGDACLGLACLQATQTVQNAKDAGFLIDRFRLPQPRTDVGPQLVGFASAAADVSDGLVADLGHICRASGLSAEIVLEDVPLSEAARRLVTDNQPLHLSLLGGGDDYEIVFTAPPTARDHRSTVARATGVPITRIGRMVVRNTAVSPVVVLDAQGDTLEAGDGGYRHFKDAEPG
jgi:thiamine-monophosphate kinase